MPFAECSEESTQNSSLLCSSENTGLICCPKILPHEKDSEVDILDRTSAHSFTEKCIDLNDKVVSEYNEEYDQNLEYPSVAVIGYYNGHTVTWLCVGAIVSI